MPKASTDLELASDSDQTLMMFLDNKKKDLF
jgi:hypothetical protein